MSRARKLCQSLNLCVKKTSLIDLASNVPEIQMEFWLELRCIWKFIFNMELTRHLIRAEMSRVAWSLLVRCSKTRVYWLNITLKNANSYFNHIKTRHLSYLHYVIFFGRTCFANMILNVFFHTKFTKIRLIFAEFHWCSWFHQNNFEVVWMNKKALG